MKKINLHAERLAKDPVYKHLYTHVDKAFHRMYAASDRRKRAAWKKSYTLPEGDAQLDLRHASKPWPSEKVAHTEYVKACELLATYEKQTYEVAA